MAFGYTCDWCGKQGPNLANVHSDSWSIPQKWSKIRGEHVCGDCVDNARNKVKSTS